MAVCATCLQPGIRDHTDHDCPGLGEIRLTRQLGHGLIVKTAPKRARMALALLNMPSWGATMVNSDQINIADQVLYQVVGYHAESASLVLDLVEDWRKPAVITFDRRMSDAEVEAFKAEWQRRYGRPGIVKHEPIASTEEESGA